MIEGVKVETITRYPDQRGYFQEQIRSNQSPVPISQISIGRRIQGISNGWHIHQNLSEWMFVVTGAVRLVLRDCRGAGAAHSVVFPYRPFGYGYHVNVEFGDSATPDQYDEIYLSEHSYTLNGTPYSGTARVYIPSGVAHGYKVLEGPCYMLYVASNVYDPSDEGRIEWYRWAELDWTRGIETK
jgi:dTDP-4-dehydrorhamnose 3,5-epimerase-like enzyme